MCVGFNRFSLVEPIGLSLGSQIDGLIGFTSQSFVVEFLV